METMTMKRGNIKFENLIFLDKKKLCFKKKSILSMNYCYDYLEKSLLGEHNFGIELNAQQEAFLNFRDRLKNEL